MRELQIPSFGVLLAPFIGQVPPQALPRFLALLERGAAERYRYWAEQLPQHAEVLLRCAAAEDEIADRVEAAFALDPALHDALRAPLPEARAAYYAVFHGLDVWDQLRIQANAERQGAQAWRTIAADLSDQRIIGQLAACSALEEASADRLDALIVCHSWQWTPFPLFVIYAGLQMLPQEPFEAARIDGASAWQQMRFITLPLAWPVIGIALTFRLIGAFRSFDILYAVTKGGPGRATDTLIIQAYQESFSYFRIEYGLVVGIIMMLITIVMCALSSPPGHKERIKETAWTPGPNSA